MVRAFLVALVLLPTTAMAAPNYNHLCAGWAGKWHTETAVIRDEKTRAWKPEDTDPDWRVELIAPGKCRFYFDKQAPFEVDTSNGFYDVTDTDSKGKPRKYRGVFADADIKGPRDWSVVVDTPPPPGGKYYQRYDMSIMGDVLLVRFLERTNPADPYSATDVSVHRARP